MKSDEICQFCGSPPTFYLNDNKLVQCRDCDLIFLSPELKNKNLESYYSEGDFWKNQLVDPEAVAMAVGNSQECLGWIKNYLGDYRGKRLLDIGAHHGFFVDEAKKSGFGACGIEINKHLVEEAQKRGVPLYLGSAEKFSIPSPFNVITMFHVLEHVEDPKLVVSNIVKNLRPGGLFVLEVPNIESYLAKNHGLSWRYIALEHLLYFSPKTLFNLLSSFGFEILMHKRRNYEVQYMSLGNIREYFFPTKNFYRNRFQPKNKTSRAIVLSPRIKFIHNLVKNIGIKKFLYQILNLLNRGDHLFVIARRV